MSRELMRIRNAFILSPDTTEEGTNNFLASVGASGVLNGISKTHGDLNCSNTRGVILAAGSRPRVQSEPRVWSITYLTPKARSIPTERSDGKSCISYATSPRRGGINPL